MNYCEKRVSKIVFFPHLLHQFVAYGVDLSFETLLALGKILVIKGKVKAQKVLQGRVVGDAISLLCRNIRKERM